MSQCFVLSNTGNGSAGTHPSGGSGAFSYMQSANVPALNFQANDFTIVAKINIWAAYNAVAGGTGRGAPIISHIEYNGGNPHNGFELTLRDTELRLYCWNAGSESYALAKLNTTTFNAGDLYGRWWNVAVRKEDGPNDNWTFFFNGTERFSGSSGTDDAVGDIDSGTPVYIGAGFDGSTFKGALPGGCNAWVYDVGFTDNELGNITDPANAIDPEDNDSAFFDGGETTLYSALVYRGYSGRADWMAIGSEAGENADSADPLTSVTNVFYSSDDSAIGLLPIANASFVNSFGSTQNCNETQSKAIVGPDGRIYIGNVCHGGYNKCIAVFNATTLELEAILSHGAQPTGADNNDILIGPYHANPVIAAGDDNIVIVFSNSMQGPSSIRAYSMATSATKLTSRNTAIFAGTGMSGGYFLNLKAYDHSGTDRYWLSGGQKVTTGGRIRAVCAYSDNIMVTMSSEFVLIDDSTPNNFVCNAMHAEEGVVVLAPTGLYGQHGIALCYSYDDCANVYALKNAVSGYAMTLGSETKSTMSTASAFAWESDGSSWRIPTRLIYDSATKQGWLICIGSDTGGEAFWQDETPSGEPTGTVGVYILKFTLPSSAGSGTGATYEWFGPFFSGAISRDGGVYDAKFIDSDRIGLIVQVPFRDPENEPSSYVDYPDGAKSLSILSAPWDNPSAMKSVGLVSRPSGGSTQPFIDTYEPEVHKYCWGMGQVIQSARWIPGTTDTMALFVSDQRFTGQQQEFTLSRVVLQNVDVPFPSEGGAGPLRSAALRDVALRTNSLRTQTIR